MAKQIRASIPDEVYAALVRECEGGKASYGEVITQALREFLVPAEQAQERQALGTEVVVALLRDVHAKLDAALTQSGVAPAAVEAQREAQADIVSTYRGVYGDAWLEAPATPERPPAVTNGQRRRSWWRRG